MFIATVYIRFFRSFNFDYLRKAHDGFVPDPWDELETGGLQYPFVKVPLEDGVTTVVGANESGKSQLLWAIKHALTGQGIERGDFCRYSQFFAVDRSMAFPDFGLEFKDLDLGDRAALAKACKVKLEDEIDSFSMFRIGGKEPVVYVRQDGDWVKYAVKDKKFLDGVLPQWFEIDAMVALPESVPIKYLAEAKKSPRTGPRRERQSFVNTILEHASVWFGSKEQITAAAPALISAFNAATQDTADHESQLVLADDLLLKVAKIDRTAFQELLKAVDASKDGFANGIVERMNRALAASLNFPKWWSQDHHFQLLLTLRDQDLVFTIRDRTGTEYSADERSGGLKYFLSYFVQYLAHEPPKTGAREVLLMDEPDAYLSSTGQQDLLRVFEDFDHPEGQLLLLPPGEVPVHRLPRREIHRQRPPRTTGTHHIQDRVHDVPTSMLLRPTTPRMTGRRRQQRLHHQPLRIRQIRRIPLHTRHPPHPAQPRRQDQPDTPTKISNTLSAYCLTGVVAVLFESEVAFYGFADLVAGCWVAVG